MNPASVTNAKLVVVDLNGQPLGIIKSGTKNTVKVGQKAKLKVIHEGDGKIADDAVSAARQGDALELTYADGTVVVLDGFYSNHASVELPADGGSTFSVTSDTVGHGGLVYTYAGTGLSDAGGMASFSGGQLGAGLLGVLALGAAGGGSSGGGTSGEPPPQLQQVKAQNWLIVQSVALTIISVEY